MVLHNRDVEWQSSLVGELRRSREQRVETMKPRNKVLVGLFLLCFLPANVALCAQRAERADRPKTNERKVAETRKKPAKKVTLAQKLSRRVTVDTKGEMLTNFIDRLGRKMDVNIVIDYSVLYGRPEIRLHRYRLKDIPLGNVLHVILRSVALDFKAYENFVFISTAPRLRHYSLEKLETRFYKLDSAAMESLPKVALFNPAAAAQGNFGSMMPLMMPVSPGLTGGATPASRPTQPPQ